MRRLYKPVDSTFKENHRLVRLFRFNPIFLPSTIDVWCDIFAAVRRIGHVARTTRSMSEGVQVKIFIKPDFALAPMEDGNYGSEWNKMSFMPRRGKTIY